MQVFVCDFAEVAAHTHIPDGLIHSGWYVGWPSHFANRITETNRKGAVESEWAARDPFAFSVFALYLACSTQVSNFRKIRKKRRPGL